MNESQSGMTPQDEKVVLVVDLENKSINALKNEEGEAVPFKETRQSEFLNVDKSNMLENFFSNFTKQYGEPTKFKILEVPAKMLDSAFKFLDKLFQVKPPENTLAFVNNYEVDIQERKAGIVQQTTKPGGKEQEYDEKNYRTVNESMVDWGKIEKELGIKRETLIQKGFLEDLLHGRKTKGTVNINIDLGYAKLRGEARLQFVKNDIGQPILRSETVRSMPELKTYNNYTFSEEDKKNLQRTGHMQKTASITDRGERVNAVIGLDPYTHQLQHVRVSDVKIPDKLCGVTLDRSEREALAAGKKIFVEGMVSPRTGKEFDAFLQINPDTRRVEFDFGNQNIFERRSVGGVQLGDNQLNALEAGAVIKVEDMFSKKTNEFYDRFIKVNPVTGQPDFYKFNPDNPGDIIIPKYLGGVQLDEETRNALAKGEPVWIAGLRSSNGDLIDRFAKLDLDSGNTKYGKDLKDFDKSLDEFSEQKAKIPQDMYGHKFTTKEYQDLQNFKAVFINDFTGYDGKTFGSWLKVSKDTGRMGFYDQNPDEKQKTQRSTVSNNASQVNRQGRGNGIA